jgi:hypothetical protein
VGLKQFVSVAHIFSEVCLSIAVNFHTPTKLNA